MNEHITSAAELDAPRYLRMVKCTERSCGTRVRYSELTDDANTHWHIRPGVALVTIPDQPQRVQPSVEEVAQTLIAHPWPSPFFKDICPTCMAEVKAGPNSPDHAAHQARAVLALFASAPTVAEVKAEALREGARHYVGRMRAMDPNWQRVEECLNTLAADIEEADRIEREARS